MHSLGSGYRFGCSYWWTHWLDPRTYYYYVKYKIQRANRGWANCDTWSLDNYLSEWLPDALRHLKANQHGYPPDMYEPGEATEENNYWPGEEAEKRAIKKWEGIVDKMIMGFEAYNRMQQGLYEDELGPYPSLTGDFLDRLNNPTEEEKERFEKSRELEKRDQKIFQEGAELFIKHFQSLWD